MIAFEEYSWRLSNEDRALVLAELEDAYQRGRHDGLKEAAVKEAAVLAKGNSMTTLIEDMARAIAAFEGYEWSKLKEEETDWRDAYRGMAKAALAVVISSLREPSSAMINAGDEFGGAGKCKPTPVTESVWFAMFEQWVKENAS